MSIYLYVYIYIYTHTYTQGLRLPLRGARMQRGGGARPEGLRRAREKILLLLLLIIIIIIMIIRILCVYIYIYIYYKIPIYIYIMCIHIYIYMCSSRLSGGTTRLTLLTPCLTQVVFQKRRIMPSVLLDGIRVCTTTKALWN